MTVHLEHDDMLQAIPRLVAEGVVCDAVVTDPPYHLVAASQRANHYMRPGPHQRTIGGFMGQQWDGGDIAFRPETWATVATILRPGAFLVVFGGTRTHHRVWSAIEDAGFVIQDTIMWMFGSGFPKRRDMLKPAFEPICLAYKPGGKRTMQVDECRISTAGEEFTAPKSNPANRRGVVGIAMQARSDTVRNQAAQAESIEPFSSGYHPTELDVDGDPKVAAR